MFGSFMPNFGGRMSKASAMFGNQTPGGNNKQGGFGNFAMNLGQGLGRGMSRGMPADGSNQFTPNFGNSMMGQLGNMGMQMGRALAPQQMPFMMQQPKTPQEMPMPDYMQGRVPGDMSGMLGNLGAMYRQGKIKTMGNFGGFGLM